MRVAALYDVHGNVHALEAAVGDLGAVDTVLFGGDIASGPFPAETLDLADRFRTPERFAATRTSCPRLR